MPDHTGPKQKPSTAYKPGQSGNPAGRPKGSRNKLSEDFITALYHAWQERKVELSTLPFEKLVDAVGKIIPKEIHAEIEHRSVVHVPKVAETIEEWLKPSRGSPALPRNLNS